MNNEQPQVELFDCPNIPTLRLTPVGCGNRFTAAASLPKRSTEPLAKCRGCAIGACHAGVEPPPQPAVAVSCNCKRCYKAASKLVFGDLCVSCYNRQREVERGANARGSKPVRARPLRPFVALVPLQEGIRRIGVALVAHGVEGALRVEHAADLPLIAGYGYRESGLALTG